MKNKILILSLAAALSAGGLLALRAHAETAGPRRAPGALLQRVKERLGITPEQAVKIRAVLKDDRGTLANLARAVHDAHIKLRETIQQDGASETDVRAASAQLAKAQADMAFERHKLFGKLKPILTAEQLNRLAGMQDRIDAFVAGAIGKFEEKLAE